MTVTHLPSRKHTFCNSFLNGISDSIAQLLLHPGKVRKSMTFWREGEDDLGVDRDHSPSVLQDCGHGPPSDWARRRKALACPVVCSDPMLQTVSPPHGHLPFSLVQ